MGKALKVLTSMLKGERPVTCESCGQEFNCGVSLKGCWCSEIELTESDRANLKSQFKDCLCRNCLETLSSKSESTSPI
jgi:hypothetical protein